MVGLPDELAEQLDNVERHFFPTFSHELIQRRLAVGALHGLAAVIQFDAGAWIMANPEADSCKQAI
jgi:hypothetical protein